MPLDLDQEDALAASVARVIRHAPNPEIGSHWTSPSLRKKRKPPLCSQIPGERARRRRNWTGHRAEPPKGAFNASSHRILLIVRSHGRCSYRQLCHEAKLEQDHLGCAIGELIQARLLGFQGEGEDRRYFILEKSL